MALFGPAGLADSFKTKGYKKSIQVAVHYSAHIGIAPSLKLTGFLRKYHY